MLKEKKTSQALIDETRDAIQQARLAIRHSRQLLTHNSFASRKKRQGVVSRSGCRFIMAEYIRR
jgi:hypothetical protein